MPLISMVGPHAVGKTTAMRRWVNRYSGKLTGISCDLCRVYSPEESREDGWQGTVQEKYDLVAKYQQSSEITIAESARTTTLNVLSETDWVIFVLCSAELLKQHILARCEAKNKKFRDEYWTDQKLGYESSRRYLNFGEKKLNQDQIRVFWIEDQTRDWPKVDAFFGSLFRTLHNARVSDDS